MSKHTEHNKIDGVDPSELQLATAIDRKNKGKSKITMSNDSMIKIIFRNIKIGDLILFLICLHECLETFFIKVSVDIFQ